MKQLITLSTIIALLLSIYGCGSSGGGDATTPDGIYSGAITGGYGAPLNGNEKAIIYNNRLIVFSTVLGIQNIFDSELNINNNQLTGIMSIYTNESASLGTADITGTFDSQRNISASFTNGSDVNFNDGTLSLTYESAIYNRGSSASVITGSWQGQYSGFAETTTIAVDASGTITVGSDTTGCSFTGTIIPADSSVNVYNVSITSTGGVGCTTLPAATYTGLAWTEGANNTLLNFSVSNATHGRTVILTKN